jgi:hypothetical protein
VSHGTSAQQGVPVQNAGQAATGWSYAPDGSGLRRDVDVEARDLDGDHTEARDLASAEAEACDLRTWLC